jgi:hypothetical protein
MALTTLTSQHTSVACNLGSLVSHDDDDDDDLQSEIEAEHASTRIQQRETRGTFRMVNPRQRKHDDDDDDDDDFISLAIPKRALAMPC